MTCIRLSVIGVCETIIHVSYVPAIRKVSSCAREAISDISRMVGAKLYIMANVLVRQGFACLGILGIQHRVKKVFLFRRMPSSLGDN